jgi:hypothetical protein
MMVWFNLLGYQLVWFLLVIGAARGDLLFALLAATLFVLVQTIVSAQPWRELRLIGVAMLLGVVIDGVASATGWLSYASSSPALPPHGAPLWIVMLWACFATTINRSLKIVQRHPRWAALIGGIGAPAAYLAAERGWHAVTLQPLSGLLWIGVGWAVALPLMAVLGRRWLHPWEARRA